jgi:hypothetical protein
MPTNDDDDPDFIAGFDADFEELGEHAVRRRLASGDYSFGVRPMAANWLDRKAAERQRAVEDRAKRTEHRANIALAISILAIVATFIVPFVTPHIR